MNLNPPSILLPAAGAALGYWLGAKSSWAIGAGVLAGMLGNALFALEGVKSQAAAQVYADVGNGKGVAPSMGRDLVASLGLGGAVGVVYPQAALKGAEVERLGGSIQTQVPSTPVAAATAPSGGAPAAAPSLGQQLQDWAKNVTAPQQATMGNVTAAAAAAAAPAAAKGATSVARKAPPAARFHRGAGR